MKLFGRTGGYYLFWAGAIYLIVGLANGIYKIVDPTLLSMLWVVFLIVPLAFKPVADYFNMSTIWDQLKPKAPMNDEHKDNVYNLPTPKLVPPMPKVEEPAKIFYRFGVTDKQRISFQMGYSEITLNKEGCQQMIDQLTFFMNQLEDEVE